jgi:opacity protein-like surface antigen
MQSLKALRSAGMIAMLSIAGLGAASAADIIRAPQYMPPPPPPPPEQMGGFYLRGDIGAGFYSAEKIDAVPFLNNAQWNYYRVQGCSVCIATGTWNTKTKGNSIDYAPFGALGVGYQFNSWFRADVTGEYRSKAEFKIKEQSTFALETGAQAGVAETDITGKIGAIVGMVNGYVDLGTWYKLTPYLGLGLGYAKVTVSDVVESSTGFYLGGGSGTAKEKSKMQFAWALHAGVAYDISNNLKAELGYRYLNLGDKHESGTINCANAGCGGGGGHNARITTLTSHDIKAGLRWSFNDTPCCSTGPAPVAYPAPAPAPVYAPPPLTRKY